MLGREFENVLRQRAMQFDDKEYQDITETAITILTAAGYDPLSIDEMNEEVSDTVQSHLMLAMLRAPRLEKVLFAAIHDHIKTLADAEYASESSAPRHRAEPAHTCDTQHPDDPTPCAACLSEDPPMIVCNDCGEAFDSIVAAFSHLDPMPNGPALPCGESYRIVPQSEAM